MMRRLDVSAMAMVCIGVASVPASAASFLTEQIEIPYAMNVLAVGINDAGTIVGSAENQSDSSPFGFILTEGTLYELSGAYYPTGVNSKGEVTGFNGHDIFF